MEFCVLLNAYLAYISLLKGLGKIKVNEDNMREDLATHPEVIAEAIQTILRREGVAMPYEKLKELTQGKTLNRDRLHEFLEGPDWAGVPDAVRAKLKELTPESYLGYAVECAQKI